MTNTDLEIKPIVLIHQPEVDQYSSVREELQTPEATPPVEMWRALQSAERPKLLTHDTAIFYGQGPILDQETKIKAEEAAKRHGTTVEEEINSWGRTTAVAAGYLSRWDEYREAFFSGGRTGGNDYQSEAELMYNGAKQVFGDDFISPELAHTDSAGNTLENVSLTFNQMDELASQADENNPRPFNNIALVGSQFHAPRIRMMAGLFNINNPTIFSSESVVQTMMHDPKISDKVIAQTADYLIPNRDKNKDPRRAILDWLEERTDQTRIDLNRPIHTSDIIQQINNGAISQLDTQRVAHFLGVETDPPSIREIDKIKLIEELRKLGEDKTIPVGEFTSYVGGGSNIRERDKPYGHFEKAAGEETKSSIRRGQNEAMFLQGLLKVPENWLGYLGLIQNNDRLRAILRNLSRWNPRFTQGFFEMHNISLNLEQLSDVELSQFRSEMEAFRKRPADGGKREYVSLNFPEDYNPDTTNTMDGLLTHMKALGYNTDSK